jgi:hypothetical protein
MMKGLGGFSSQRGWRVREDSQLSHCFVFILSMKMLLKFVFTAYVSGMFRCFGKGGLRCPDSFYNRTLLPTFSVPRLYSVGRD